ncbi:hypothetical protein AHAS_Ahas01G0111100 [Arachis hypogaea]
MSVRGCPCIWNDFQEKGPHASIGESAPASTCRGHVWHTSAKESAPVKVWNLAEVMPLECLI